jgi:hypothetical protein
VSAPAPAAPFEHLLRLSDTHGIFEHALFREPRPEHGYCVDDVARALVVIARDVDPTPEVQDLGRLCLRFLADGQDATGLVRNRFGSDLRWADEPRAEDAWGRALWGLGTAAARSAELGMQALSRFELSADVRSTYPRAMAFASLGAGEVLRAHPEHSQARRLLAEATRAASRPGTDRDWPWPEPTLSYANAVLAEALIVGGALLPDPQALADGLRMLGWLLATESAAGHLSVAPAGGWARGDDRPGFDQQPIEVAALADACAQAHAVTGESRWLRGVELAAAWFMGANDSGQVMYDPDGGGGYDGLEQGGRNENQGAESTLAMMSTFQLAHRFAAPRS